MGEAGSKVFKVKSQFQIPYISTYDLVRIVRLGESRSNVEGESEFGKPKVGEFGEVVNHNDSGWYQVESLEKGTAQSWMGWFVRTDLDFLYGQHVDQNNLPHEAIAIAEKLRIGMTRSQVIKVLGEPEAKGVTSRKYKTPAIFKYGSVELTFELPKDGVLTLVYMEDDQGIGITLLE